MVKTMIVNGQLVTVLDTKATQFLILLLEDLQYFKDKNRITISGDERKLLEELKTSPAHDVIHSY